MICPESDCGANAEIEHVSTTPCTVYESMKFNGSERFEWEGQELLDIVEVRCTEGHRSKGPREMLHGKDENAKF